ncbi:MAG: DUF4440 domain-containing protein [Gemmatimonadaceae bacterium]
MLVQRTAAIAMLLLTSQTAAVAQERALRDSLDALRAGFVRGYKAGDAGLLQPLYLPDAVRMMYDRPAQNGSAAIVAALRQSFGSRRAVVDLRLTPEDLRLAGDLAVERGAYHEVWTPHNGSAPYVETGKYVTVARHNDGWKYLWSIFNRDSAPPPRGSPVAVPAILVGDSMASAHWQRWGEGLEMAALDGDPAVADRAYTIALRLAPGRWIRPHWHPRAKQVYVVSGMLLFGHGETLDTTNVIALPPGTVALVPGRHAHYEGARVQTVVLLSGIGPLQTNMIP